MPDPGALQVALTMDASWSPVPGGTAVAAVELARGLVAAPGVEAVGVAGRHRRPPIAELAPPVAVRHHRLPRPLLADAWHRLGRPLVEGLAPEADIVHATSIIVPATRRRLVVTVHDILFVRHPDWFTRRGVRVMSDGLRRARDRADLVLCSSEASADDCRGAGIDADRIRVVPLGVDVRPATGDAVDGVRRQHGIDRPYVLWNGTVEPRKNLAGLLRAVARWDLDGVDLVLVGPPGWRDAFPAQLVEAIDPARTRVITTGFVPRPELDALQAGATVTCLPSLAEGFGFPVLEAYAQGTPVVTSAGTSTAELVGDAGLTVDPTDPDELADALHRVVTDRELHARLSAAAPGRAAEFTWERTVERTVAAYRELVP
ncbi:MAG: glycosyltransferase family 1 protein [Actinomycetota bacterium]